MAGTAVVLDQLADQGALRVPDGQPRTEGLWPGQQVHLGGEAAMVPLLGLDQAVEVRLQGLLVGPRGAIYALEHRLLLVAPPIGTGDLLQRKVPEEARGQYVRSEAQVDEPVAVAVVGDGTIGGRLTGHLAGGGTRRDLLDDLPLVAVAGEQVQSLTSVGLMALEGLVGLDHLAHPRLDGLQVVIAERGAAGQFEVVVEAVLDGWADGVGGTRPEVQHGLGKHVCRRVSDGVEPVVAVRCDYRDAAPVGQHPVEVAAVAIDGDDQGRPCQTRADVGGQVGTGGTLGQDACGAIGKGDREFRHVGSGLLVDRQHARRQEATSRPGRAETPCLHPVRVWEFPARNADDTDAPLHDRPPGPALGSGIDRPVHPA